MSGDPDGTTATKRPVTAAAATQARWIAAVIGTLSLLLIGAFLAMVLFVHDEVPLHAVGPVPPGPGAEHGGLVFQGTVNVWTVNGRVRLDAGRTARFELDFASTGGEPPRVGLPLVLKLDRPGRDIPPLHLRHSLVAPGSYVASAQLPESGRWRLRIELPNITGLFELDVPGD